MLDGYCPKCSPPPAPELITKESTVKVDIWEAINRYVVACGGDPSRHVYGNTSRQRAVVEVERIIQSLPPVADDRVEKLKAALIGWRNYFQADIPMTGEEMEKQGEQFTQCWTEAEHLLSELNQQGTP